MCVLNISDDINILNTIRPITYEFGYTSTGKQYNVFLYQTSHRRRLQTFHPWCPRYPAGHRCSGNTFVKLCCILEMCICPSCLLWNTRQRTESLKSAAILYDSLSHAYSLLIFSFQNVQSPYKVWLLQLK